MLVIIVIINTVEWTEVGVLVYACCSARAANESSGRGDIADFDPVNVGRAS